MVERCTGAYADSCRYNVLHKFMYSTVQVLGCEVGLSLVQYCTCTNLNTTRIVRVL
jgi:hypothetical protein